MSYQLERTTIGDALRFSWVRDPKFKHNRMSVNLILPLSEETATEYALLPFLLRKGYRDCPDFTRLNARLDELYGASLNGDVSKFGASQVLELSIVGLDNRFTLDGEDIVAQCAQLLAGVVCSPNFVGGAFPAEDVALEKQFLQDTIEAEINDKRSYALSQCRSHMCKGEPTAVKRYGSIEKLAGITPESAAEAYHRAIDRAVIEILFIGSGDPSGAIEMFRQSFAALSRHPGSTLRPANKLIATQVQEHVERMPLSQSKLVMGFRAGDMGGERGQAAARLMTALYGGTPFSKLFLNVREKLSLCYYCAARLDRITGILMVDSGIEGQNKERAQAEILHQLQLLRDGEFSEEDLASAKLTMVNAMRSTTDSLGSLENWYLAQIMSGQSNSPAEDAALIDSITHDEIVAAAGRVTLDTVYLLTTKEAAK